MSPSIIPACRKRILVLPLGAIALAALLLVGMFLLLNGLPIVQAATPVSRYVATTGSDTSNDCTVSSSPCATVQHAVDEANPTDSILVASGTYTGVQARAGITQVVYINKALVVRGGYTTTNWTTSNPTASPTTLDAEGLGRVMVIVGTINPTIEGLSMTRGDATGLGGSCPQ